jgi:hypothetical protein
LIGNGSGIMHRTTPGPHVYLQIVAGVHERRQHPEIFHRIKRLRAGQPIAASLPALVIEVTFLNNNKQKSIG